MKRDPALASLLACAADAVQTAGSHAFRHIARRNVTTRTYKHDVKLKLDRECQEKAETSIRRRYPDHLILGEEDSTTHPPHRSADAYQWIIDPIDGTVNFSHGLPLWCCSIAVRRGPNILAGAVYAPALNELYTASLEQPSLRNGSRIHVSAIKRLGEAIILTGLDKHVTSRIPPFGIFERISANVQKTRIFGSAALDMCRVACGQAEGYFESGIYIWDVAAAGLIVQQAGGKAEILKDQGNNRLCFVASNGPIHSALKKQIQI
jgi:myo-inositol-1(or 4)-monophosphatase